MNTWNLFSFYVINLSEHRLLDWIAVYSMGRMAHGLLEITFTLTSQILWTGFLGAIFVFLIPLCSSKHLILKGIVFGYIIGFVKWAIPNLFKTPVLMDMTFNTIVSHAIESILFGLTLATVLQWLEKRYA